MHAHTLFQKHMEWKVLPNPLQSVISGIWKINARGLKRKSLQSLSSSNNVLHPVGGTGIQTAGKKKSYNRKKKSKDLDSKSFGLNTSLAMC